MRFIISSMFRRSYRTMSFWMSSRRSTKMKSGRTISTITRTTPRPDRISAHAGFGTAPSHIGYRWLRPSRSSCCRQTKSIRCVNVRMIDGNCSLVCSTYSGDIGDAHVLAFIGTSDFMLRYPGVSGWSRPSAWPVSCTMSASKS